MLLRHTIPVALLMTLGVLSSAVESKDDTVVDVQVKVVAGDGKPLANALVFGYTTAGFWRKATDSLGQVSVRLVVKDASERVYVQLGGASGAVTREPLPPFSEMEAEGRIFHEVFNAWGWRSTTEVLIIPAESGVRSGFAIFKGVPCVSMRGRLLTASGEPLGNAPKKPPRAIGWGSEMRYQIQCNTDGEIEAPNVPQGIAGELELIFDEGLRQWIVWPDSKAAGDFDLGDIPTKVGAPTGVVRGRIDNMVGGDTRVDRGTQPGACLISSDASHGAFVYMVEDDWRHADESPEAFAKVQRPRYVAHQVKVSAGVYFIAPGDSGAQCQRLIRDAIRKGEDVEKKWGLQRIIVEEGKETTFTLDDEKAYKAVMGELPPKINSHKSAIATDENKDDAKDAPKRP